MVERVQFQLDISWGILGLISKVDNPNLSTPPENWRRSPLAKDFTVLLCTNSRLRDYFMTGYLSYLLTDKLIIQDDPNISYEIMLEDHLEQNM